MPDPIPPTTAELQAKIDALEKKLAELPKGDPDRAQLLDRIAKLEAKLNPPAPKPEEPPKPEAKPEEPKRGRWSDHFLT